VEAARKSRATASIWTNTTAARKITQGATKRMHIRKRNTIVDGYFPIHY
jgi:hypothetical protein